ncbi:hypothetical protein RvY_03421 [Ramazzottius varieornatus]|uniref:Uncharacterized protein n=1 Tax=Ramazzottius varieornatus TaxID=947166 RepID=A0A1D1UTR6_RAMVA|nr:hypothetical protein RvY_03421 [Ramazzottius varieornatus]
MDVGFKGGSPSAPLVKHTAAGQERYLKDHLIPSPSGHTGHACCPLGPMPLVQFVSRFLSRQPPGPTGCEERPPKHVPKTVKTLASCCQQWINSSTHSRCLTKG